MVNYTKWYIDKFSIRMIKQAVLNSKPPHLQKKRTLSILLELLGLDMKLLWKWVQIGKCNLSISCSALSMMCCSPWGHKESDTTEGLKWIELIVHWVPSPENWSRHNFFFFFFCNLYNKPEKAMAPHSSTLAWKTPWTEEPGGLQSMGSMRVRHDWATSLSLFSCMRWRRKWQPTPVFLPGESQGRGSLVGCRLWGRTESDTTEVT